MIRDRRGESAGSEVIATFDPGRPVMKASPIIARGLRMQRNVLLEELPPKAEFMNT